jgi:hypothetical protein
MGKNKNNFLIYTLIKKGKNMRFIKKFKLFKEELSAAASPSPMPAPAQPSIKPLTSPGKKPKRPPSPIRRDRPAVLPDPKAEKEKELPTATIEDVIGKFAKLTNQKYNP